MTDSFGHAPIIEVHATPEGVFVHYTFGDPGFQLHTHTEGPFKDEAEAEAFLASRGEQRTDV